MNSVLQALAATRLILSTGSSPIEDEYATLRTAVQDIVEALRSSHSQEPLEPQFLRECFPECFMAPVLGSAIAWHARSLLCPFFHESSYEGLAFVDYV